MSDYADPRSFTWSSEAHVARRLVTRVSYLSTLRPPWWRIFRRWQWEGLVEDAIDRADDAIRLLSQRNAAEGLRLHRTLTDVIGDGRLF